MTENQIQKILDDIEWSKEEVLGSTCLIQYKEIGFSEFLGIKIECEYSTSKNKNREIIKKLFRQAIEIL